MPLGSSSTGHRFGRPRLLAGQPPAVAAYSGTQPFQPLPPPVGAYPFHLDLADVFGADRVAAITAAGELDFHLMGDTGGIANPVPQENVATALETDLAEKPDGFDAKFLYLLGDCVYFNGQPAQYYPQFYEPYAHYNAPIFAVPGNHDGAPADPTQTTLDGFLAGFCTTTPQISQLSGDSGRSTMTQPNVYWTLDTPFATIVGLYSNVPEHGRLDDTQIAWLHHELQTAPAGKALLLTMHHPPISADDHHGSSQYMGTLLDTAMTSTGRVPDLICAGHVHDYQRFTRTAGGVGGTGSFTYLVIGCGGYHNLHTIAVDVKNQTLPCPYPGLADTTVDAFDDTHYGYSRLRINPTQIRIQYVQVSTPPGSSAADLSPKVVDDVTLDLR